MKKNNLAAAIALALGGFFPCLTLPVRADEAQIPAENTPQWKQMVQDYHSFGLSGDRSHVAEMLPVLKVYGHYYLKGTVLLALARMGATEALPDVEATTLLPSANGFLPSDSGFPVLISATRARILAQTEPTAHAQAVRYFQEIGETPVQLNSTLRKYEASLPLVPTTSAHVLPFPNKEVVEEEQLADMIYHGPSQELLADPLMSQVDFGLWYSPRLKIEMARLTPEQQRQTLVGRIAQARQYSIIERQEAQVLIDLGYEQAVQAVTAKLQEMDADPKSYSPNGFLGLFNVLYASEDSTHSSSVWDHFQKSPDQKIRQWAGSAHSGFGIIHPGVTENGY